VKDSLKIMEFKKPQMPTIDWSNLVLCLGSASLVLVVLFLLAIPGYSYLEGRAQLAAVRSNAATVQLAAETFAAAHQGRYPIDHLDLIPYLPEDRAPQNPLTGDSTLFKGGEGDLTYRSPTKGGDYVIQAFGKQSAGRLPVLVTLKGRRDKQRI
jgi:hypothetical protein